MRLRHGLLASGAALLFALTLASTAGNAGQDRVSGLAGAAHRGGGRTNPYNGDRAVEAGRKLFGRHCATCHGADGRGKDNAPAVRSITTKTTPAGDLFWFLTNGDLRAGMPSWSRLPDAQRWQIVAFLQAQEVSP
jgi:mono/diheme cytochrome c family protein